MIYISNIEPQNDGSTYLKYTVKFEGQDHVINGTFTATKDESDKAFQNNSGGAWSGFKELIMDKINTNMNQLKGGNEDGQQQ